MPAAGAVQIANIALIELGVDVLTSLNPPDPVTEGRIIAARYDTARRATLRDHTWNCAIKRSALSALATGPVFGWSNYFVLPADCLRVIGDEDRRVRYAVELSPTKERVIGTDEGSFNLIYVSDLTDVSLMDDLLIEAIAYKLASSVAMKLAGGSPAKRSAMENLYQRRLDDARYTDAIEGSFSQLSATRFLDARFGSGDSYRPISPVTP